MARKNAVIKFEESIVVGGKELKEVTMRVPKGKDLRMVSHVQDPIDRDYTLISNLCDLNATSEEFDEFGIKEIVQMQQALQSFL